MKADLTHCMEYKRVFRIQLRVMINLWWKPFSALPCIASSLALQEFYPEEKGGKKSSTYVTIK
jgi:hypothetical protein